MAGNLYGGLLIFEIKGRGESTPFSKYLVTFKSAKVVNILSAATANIYNLF